MVNLFTLSARLNLETDDYTRRAKEAENTGRSLANKMSVWSQTIAHAAGDMLSRGVRSTLGFVKNMSKQALNLAGELEQNLGGAEAVYGDYYYFIRREGEKAYKQLGLSQSNYLAEANKMGSLLQGMGYTQEDAAETTIKVMQRASDVASIMGLDVSAAMQAVEGAAKGNFTMMDNLGVAMNDTTLNAYALEKGLGKTTQQMSTMEKVQLAFEYFMEKTAKYAGNYAKENDTLAGSMTTLNAAWENFLSGAGDADSVIESAEGALNAVWKTAQNLAPKLWQGAKRMFQKVWPNVSTWIGQQVQNLPQTIGNFVTTGANGVIDLINGIFGTNIPHIKDIKLPSWQEIKTKATSAINTLIKEINTVFGTDLPKIENIKLPTWEEIKATATVTLNELIDDINKFLGTKIPKIGEIELPTWDEAKGAGLEALRKILQGIKDVADWFITNKDSVVSALEAIGLALVTYSIVSSVEKLSAAVTTLMAAGGLKAVFSGLTGLSVPGLVIAGISAAIFLIYDNWEAIKKAFVDVGDAIKGAWENFKNFVKERIPPSWLEAIRKIAGAWNQVWGAIRKAIDAFREWAGLNDGGPATVHTSEGGVSHGGGGRHFGDNFDSDQFYARGIDYIPNTMRAILHRGETVLNAHDAARWRANGGRNQDYNNGTSAIVEAIQGLRNDFDNLRLYVGEQEFGRAIVDYGGSRVNSYIGGTNRKIRRGYGRT